MSVWITLQDIGFKIRRSTLMYPWWLHNTERQSYAFRFGTVTPILNTWLETCSVFNNIGQMEGFVKGLNPKLWIPPVNRNLYWLVCVRNSYDMFSWNSLRLLEHLQIFVTGQQYVNVHSEKVHPFKSWIHLVRLGCAKIILMLQFCHFHQFPDLKVIERI